MMAEGSSDLPLLLLKVSPGEFDIGRSRPEVALMVKLERLIQSGNANASMQFHLNPLAISLA
jgi:hypothetical protein